jgi:2-hydroxycyclohexanecarboxyl-CoA dehydrogenase
MDDPASDTPRVVVVTGGGSGIGRATCLLLGRAGLRVAVADIDETAAINAVQEAERAGIGANAYGVDVTNTQSVQQLAEAVCDGLGVPWAVVNCAGWDESRPFEETAPPFWEQVLAINLLGVIATCHAFLGPMIERGGEGRFVNVASDAGRVGSSREAVYSGAKGGVIAFTKSLARETARYGITANAVCPGPTDTPLFRAQPERLQEALIRAVPMKRLGQPSDVAQAIAFFASDGAAFVTGQVLSVSGGLTMAG